MAQSTISTCKICLEKFKQEGGNVLVPNSKSEYSPKKAVKIRENSVICKRCKMDQVRMRSEPLLFVKEEIKEEFVEEESVPVLNGYKQNLTDRMCRQCFKCNVCNYTTADKLSLITHKQIHLNKGKLNQHMGNRLNKQKKCNCELGRKSFNCNVCNAFKTYEYNFSCYNCDYKTSSKCALVKHMMVHSTLFKCEFCDFSSKRPSTLQLHLESSESNFSCDRCDYTSYSRCNFMSHKKVHSKEKSKPWKKPKLIVNHKKKSSDTSTRSSLKECHYKLYSALTRYKEITILPVNTRKSS
ncbi:hypothetical protein FQR65_LT16809 [Abscondita terminalis]|nr:hypothetical protein FQR65_LT16809 [Abscondita terminalis]